MTSADGNLIFLPTIGILRFFPAPIHHAGDRDLFPDKCSKLKLCSCGGPSSLTSASGLAAPKRDFRYRHRMSVLGPFSDLDPGVDGVGLTPVSGYRRSTTQV